MNKLSSILALCLVLASQTSSALNQDITIWDELGMDSSEIGSVMLGISDQMEKIEKTGELVIEKIEKRPAGPLVDVYRMKGIVLQEDGLVENEFALLITRVKQEKGLARNFMYCVLYQEKRIN